MTPHSYSHKFPGGYRCTFMLEADGTGADWTPAPPPKNWTHWRTYARWRDRSCADYAERTGVLFTITFDIPWAGVRSYSLKFRDSVAAYAYASARRESLLNAKEKFESHPGIHAQILAGLERSILEHAPRSAGGAA